MADHRANVLVTACLKAPVDPRTKAPLASYERDAAPRRDNRDCEQLEFEDSGSDSCDEEAARKGGPPTPAPAKAQRLDLRQIFFSNEEYYRKLQELKEAHLQTMADLESMYQQKLLLKTSEAPDAAAGPRLRSSDSRPAASPLRRSRSAVDLRRSSAASGGSHTDQPAADGAEAALLVSPKEYIKNMWRDFQVPPHTRHLSSSLRSLPGAPKRQEPGPGGAEAPKHQSTVPRPFQMTLRESERRRHGIKTRAEVEVENRELRRRLEELTECQRKFRASPVPAHVYLAERRTRLQEAQSLGTVPKPFSFLERERLKKEQREQGRPPDQDKVRAFKAKPVPRSVYAAASAEQVREEQLYRSIKIHMRAQELLHSAATPPSMTARRLSQRKRSGEGGAAAGGDGFAHSPRINREVPDFEARYRCFQKHLQKHKELKPTTTCQPFDLRTSRASPRRERVLADLEREQSSPRERRWPFISPGPPRTPNSSLCSSLSGSLELLPTKVTGATKKRHEAVRKVLEQRKKAEEEEERWREEQRQRERRLQRVVSQRAQANDPHLALAQTHHSKLREFRRQEQQRRREYQQEIREMQRRVKGRPLLLEQVAQKNAKEAADRRFVDALQGCDLTEEFVLSTAAGAAAAASELRSNGGEECDPDQPDLGYQPVRYRRVFLNEDDVEVSPNEEDGGGAESPLRQHGEDGDGGDDEHCSGDGLSYSDDHESYSTDSDHDVDTAQQEAQ